MAVTSKEIAVKFSYAKSDGTVSTGTKNFTGCLSSLSADTLKTKIPDYALAVAGTTKSAVLKSVEPIDLD